MNNILVTGSNGYLGSWIITKLLEYKEKRRIYFDKLYLYDNLRYNQLSLLDKIIKK